MTKMKATPAAVEEPLADVDASLDDIDNEGDGDEAVTEVEVGQVMHRPDGYYWQTPDGKQEYGPFETLESALAHLESSAEEASEPGETLQEAEDEIGVADWIDPDT